MDIQKPSEIIFSFTSLSYIQQRIFNILIWFALNKNKPYPFKGYHFIKISLVKEILHGDLIDNNDSYLKKSITGIVDNKFSYNIFATPQTSKQILHKPLFDFLSISNNIIKYSLDEDFEIYFKKDRHLTTLYSQDMTFLKSKYSLRLYELAKALSHSNIKSIPYDIFKRMMGVYDRYHSLSSFRTRVLEVAQSEILKYVNTHIGYYVSMKENVIFLYSRPINVASMDIEYMNILFASTSLLYRQKHYSYKGIFLDTSIYAYSLAIISVETKADFIVKKSSIEELKLFIQKHISMSPC